MAAEADESVGSWPDRALSSLSHAFNFRSTIPDTFPSEFKLIDVDIKQVIMHSVSLLSCHVAPYNLT